MKLPEHFPAVLDPIDGEADVVRIRLWNARCGCALLSEFHSADRVLASWADRFGNGAVVFEVTFEGGVVLQGAHEFYRKGRRKCLFATHVQRILRNAALPVNAGRPSPPLGPARCFVRT